MRRKVSRDILPVTSPGQAGQARPEEARLPAVQNGAVLKAGGVYEAKRIRSHYLPSPTGRLRGFCMPLRYNAKPHSLRALVLYSDMFAGGSDRDKLGSRKVMGDSHTKAKVEDAS